MESSDWTGEFERRLKPLWQLALAGDNAAYEQALVLMAQRLRVLFRRRLTAMPDEVEDLVQETLMAIHLKRSSYDDRYPVSAWVLSIGKYKLVDFWRRHGRRDALHDDIEQTDPQDLAEIEQEPGTSRDLEKLLQTLPQAQRTAIELTKLQGMTVVEAASQTGMSVSAIKVNVHRGLQRLSRLIGKPSP